MTSRVDVDILDVAPIVLAGLGLPKDGAMTGTVPPGLWPSKGRIEHGDVLDKVPWPPSRDAGMHEQQLRELGYVD